MMKPVHKYLLVIFCSLLIVVIGHAAGVNDNMANRSEHAAQVLSNSIGDAAIVK